MSKLIRDNKNILNLLVKKAYPYVDMVGTRFTTHYYINKESACDKEVFSLRLKTTKDMYTWVEDKHNLFYCIDINKLFRYSNVCKLGVDGTTKFDSNDFNDKLLNFVMCNITYSLNRISIEDINRMLHFYGITDIDYNSFNGLCDDTQVYKDFETKLVEEVTLRTKTVLQDFFDEVKLFNTVKIKLINGTMLPLMRYDTKTGKVYVPISTNISYVELMSRAGSGKDGRKVFEVSELLNDRVSLIKDNVLFILSTNDYDIPLGGAF